MALAHGNDVAVAAIAKTRGGVSEDEAADAAVAADAASESAADKAAE